MRLYFGGVECVGPLLVNVFQLTPGLTPFRSACTQGRHAVLFNAIPARTDGMTGKPAKGSLLYGNTELLFFSLLLFCPNSYRV